VKSEGVKCAFKPTSGKRLETDEAETRRRDVWEVWTWEGKRAKGCVGGPVSSHVWIPTKRVGREHYHGEAFARRWDIVTYMYKTKILSLIQMARTL
jgi:hypothetical protein